MSKKMMALFAAVICLSIAASAAAPEDSCAGKEKCRGEKMAKELGLSTQQKAKLKEFREEMREVHQTQMEKIKALREKSKEELLKPVPSRDVLAALAKESGELRRVMAEKEADHMLKVKAVLTPEQFAKLLSKDFMLRMEQGPGGPHDGKGPHEKGPHHEMDE